MRIMLTRHPLLRERQRAIYGDDLMPKTDDTMGMTITGDEVPLCFALPRSFNERLF